MKTLIMFLLLVITNNNFAKENDELIQKSYRQYRTLNFYSALDTIAKSYRYKTPDKKTAQYIEGLTRYTGTYYFNTFSDKELRKMNIPSTDLIMAKRNLYLKKFKYVHKRLARTPETSRLYPESLLVRASAYYQNKNYKKSIEFYNKCSESAVAWKSGQFKKIRNNTKNYFSIIQESCIINVARLYFKLGSFQKAIQAYDKIPKKSLKWPYILLEKAWTYYYLGRYNRSLGLLITYNSPLLESYFMPEAEVLKALNYYRLCLYEDSLYIIENFYKQFKPKSIKLRNLLKGKVADKNFYFELMHKPIKESEKESKFLRNLITQMMKRSKYNLDMMSLNEMNKEIKRGHKESNIKMLRVMKKDIKEQINHYIKVSMYKFINEIHSLSGNMFNLKLEVLSKQRDLIYKRKTVTLPRSRGSIKNIQSDGHNELWSFENAFWADELGEYTFSLKSNCSVKSLDGYRR